MPPLLDRGLLIEEVRRADQLEGIRPAWRALWEATPGPTPFQSPEWLLAWWRHLGGEGLWTLAMRCEGRLVAIAPFFVFTHPHTGVRQVTLLGNGITDSLDLLADREDAPACASSALAHLAAKRATWDRCDFRDLPACSALLSASVPSGIRAEVVSDEPSPSLLLPHRVEEMADAIPARLLEKVRYCRRRAEKSGEVRFAQARGDAVNEAFGALLDLHRARWSARGEPGVLADPRIEAFHRDIVREFSARDWLRLYTLHIGGRVAAVYYGFVANGRAYYYLSGFDPSFERLSPGTLIVHHAIQEAVREGASEMDFLRGREAYKYGWGAQDRAKRRLRLKVDPR